MAIASAKEQRTSRSRSFPWRCSNCGKLTVKPTLVDYIAKVKHDGSIRELLVPRIRIPRCKSCGNLVITTAIDERINDTLRSQFNLLSPDQIRSNIHKLGLTQLELAEWLDVAPETISRWLTGALIQSSRMNKRLRMFFAFPEAREMLRRLDREPELGTEVNLLSGSGEMEMPAGQSPFKPDKLAVLSNYLFYAAEQEDLVEEVRHVINRACVLANEAHGDRQDDSDADKATEFALAEELTSQLAAEWDARRRDFKTGEEDWGEFTEAYVADNGKRKVYVDGTPNLEIRTAKKQAKPLPYQVGKSVSVRLRIGGVDYRAELHSTKNNKYIWIKPVVIGPRQEKLRLGRILTEEGFEPNERIQLRVNGELIVVHKHK